MGLRWLAAFAVSVSLAACGGSQETVSVYLAQRLGPDGPPGQIAPILMPVERTLRTGIPTPYQVVLLVRQGPAPGEWGQGFIETIDTRTRVRSVSVEGRTATVQLVGREPSLYGSAAIVFSLTSLPGIENVQLLLDGKSCCLYAHSGQPVETLNATHFDYWQGEPCAMRVETDAVRCREE